MTFKRNQWGYEVFLDAFLGDLPQLDGSVFGTSRHEALVEGIEVEIQDGTRMADDHWRCPTIQLALAPVGKHTKLTSTGTEPGEGCVKTVTLDQVGLTGG